MWFPGKRPGMRRGSGDLDALEQQKGVEVVHDFLARHCARKFCIGNDICMYSSSVGCCRFSQRYGRNARARTKRKKKRRESAVRQDKCVRSQVKWNTARA